MAKLIDGKLISAEVLDSVRERVEYLKSRGVEPCLAVIIVGDDPASRVYVNNKKKSCEKVGIKSLGDRRSHWRPSRPLWRIQTCEDFVVDELTYSVPYLVPEAYNAVHEIGRRFRDSVRTRGGGEYRMIVTSVLRTPDAVRRLRRVNRNAIDSSVHQLATTVDISYAKFMGSPEPTAQTVGELKGVLSEVLAAMRSEGKIWVKYEYHQPCFHLTCRPVGNKQ